jgi:hypothetical protein
VWGSLSKNITVDPEKEMEKGKKKDIFLVPKILRVEWR